MKVSKGRLKAKMLEYFRQVEKTGEELIVTHNDEPRLKVIRINKKKTVEVVFSDLRGKISIDDSVMTPETDEWGV